MIPQIALIALVASQQVMGEIENDGHSVEKRSVSALARMGQLPYHQGKRYVAALARNGDLMPFMRPAWNKKLHHSLEDLEERLEEDQLAKRYLGALARAGDLRGSREDKRDDIEGMIGEELRRLRLEALREELTDDQRAAPEDDEFYSDEEFLEGPDGPDKRGGISSLAKNGYGFPKRNTDDDLEELMSEVYGIDDKRNVASLARSFNFPNNADKKNIGSLLRSGGMPHLTKKDLDDDWDEYGEDKRNLASVVRDRNNPLGEGKRHLGSLMKGYSPEKKNVGALARNRDFPMSYRFGKREWSEDDSEEIGKRYVAALLRQGRLPVGQHQDGDSSEGGRSEEAKEDTGRLAEEKPSQGNLRKKKSVEEHQRAKRETFIPLPAASSDYILPVVRGYSQFVDDDRYADDSPINKRIFAARGGGKIPTGRLTQINRRSRMSTNGRRRQY